MYRLDTSTLYLGRITRRLVRDPRVLLLLPQTHEIKTEDKSQLIDALLTQRETMLLAAHAVHECGANSFFNQIIRHSHFTDANQISEKN